MNVIYTMRAINGIVEVGPKPATSNAARCALLDTLGDAMKEGWIERYALKQSKEFEFPFKKPNPTELREFFGGEKDLNVIQGEIDELFAWPEKQLEASKETLAKELESAKTKEAFIELLNKYHFQGPANKKQDILNNSITEDLSRLEREFDEGDMKEVHMHIERMYYDWRRSHVALLYNRCGDAIYYGAGYWMARIIPIENTTELLKFFDDARMPYQTIIRQDIENTR